MALRSDFSIDAVTPKDPRASGHTLQQETELSANAGFQTRTLIARNLRKGGTERIDLEHFHITDIESPRRRVAFLVTHGMGQQVPFETVSMLGQALLTQHGTQKNVASPSENPRAKSNRVRLTEQPDAPELSRVEVTLTADDGEEVDVHLYESYWAPFTEGQISFLATVKFLYFAALNGIWTAIKARRRAKKTGTDEMSPAQTRIAKKSDGMKHFDRWMFGEFHDMPIKRWTFWLLVTLVIVLTLALLPSLLIFTSFGISAVKYLYTHFGPTVTRLSLPWRILGGGAAALVLGIALIVRYAVVEFVGDVAIYVSSYKVSHYDEIRTKILNAAMNVARQIYSAGMAGDDLQLPYDDVVIVGHSLGSVISYDLLNWCINWDQVENKFEYDVVARTRRLITFGSPLDKTAFLFRTQVSDARNLREALAARQQPLILDYVQFRPLETFKWINIYAPADIISGSLEYYDVEGLPGYNKIENVKDPEATKPLLAHIQYWNNTELHKRLYDAAWAGVHVHTGPSA